MKAKTVKRKGRKRKVEVEAKDVEVGTGEVVEAADPMVKEVPKVVVDDIPKTTYDYLHPRKV